ncbi:MAG: polyphosphate kinase 1 [Acidobacteria bacterium]|nr:polyphosphate kinase 1 [Acidobacteriota bacterium]
MTDHADAQHLKVTPKTKTAVTPTESFDGPRLFNRELSWLEFNRRVLDEAMQPDIPLLEQLKFLAIFATNLDEFFMIRVSGLKEQIEEGITKLSPDGMTATEQLREIGKRLRPMLKKHVDHLRTAVLPQLAEVGITIEPYKKLNSRDRKKLDKYFRDNLFPILTPQSVDSSHPFPYISNLSLNIGLFVEPNRQYTQKDLKYLFRQKRFTRIKLPPAVPRLIPINENKGRFTLLEEVISANAHELFPNMKTSEGFLFRVTRDADIELREDEAGDLLRTLERELQRRRFRFPVRLEVAGDMPERMTKLLADGIGLSEQDIYRIDGFVDIPDLMQLYSLDRPALKEKPIPVVYPSILHEKKNPFNVIKKQDVLLHHPYISFSTVSDFIAAAAEDADVQAIKICLYRAGKDSPIVRSLVRASRLGKQVTAVVELKARFDEENNIEWARLLENEGVHVVYGIHTLKTHSKVLLVVRREKEKLVRYVHIGTGNYNPITSRLYTDLGMITADEQIGEDASSLFNFMTGYSQHDNYNRMLVAPLNLREQLRVLIQREVENKQKGLTARIIIKVNSLTDEELIDDLYRASTAGIEIDLIVRGICSLRPGIKGLSENIRVRSIVGRFLEHSRIFYFANAGEEEIYIGSADWMLRNLDRRVEVVIPVVDEQFKHYLRHDVLGAYLRDNLKARVLRPDGTYRRVSPGNSEPFDSQMSFVGSDLTF